MAEELITQFKVTYYDHAAAGKLAIMTMDNGADYKKPNTFGTGAMLEWERLDPGAVDPGDPVARDTVRMANVGVLRYETERGLRVLNILYVQPRFDVPADMRILNDLGITVPVSERVRLSVSGEWRRDTRPPAKLKKDDLTLKWGIALDFGRKR